MKKLTFGLGEVRASALRVSVLARGERVALMVAFVDAARVRAQVLACLGVAVRCEMSVRFAGGARAELVVWPDEPVCHLGAHGEVLATLAAVAAAEGTRMLLPRNGWTAGMAAAFARRVFARVEAAHPECGWVRAVGLPVFRAQLTQERR